MIRLLVSLAIGFALLGAFGKKAQAAAPETKFLPAVPRGEFAKPLPPASAFMDSVVAPPLAAGDSIDFNDTALEPLALDIQSAFFTGRVIRG